jgi:exopolysaccharide biosynthesis polyprenyl glycosylphosphotransferase
VVPVREVVLHGDMRAPKPLAQRLLGRYGFRRVLSVLALVLVDALCVTLGALAVSWGEVPVRVWVAAIAVAVVCAGMMGLYGLRWRRRDHLHLAMWAVLILPLFFLVLLCFGKIERGGAMFLGWAVAVLAAITLRWIYEIGITWLLGAQSGTQHVLAVGDATSAALLVTALNRDGDGQSLGRYTLIGTVPVDDVDGLAHAVRESGATELLVPRLETVDPRLDDVLDVARRYGMNVLVAAETLGDDAVCQLPGASAPVFAVRASHTRRWRFVIKRVFDVVMAFGLLVLSSPFLLVVALLIKASSHGPVLFVSWRMGVGDRPFPCFKFRTMIADAETRQAELESVNEADGHLFKLADDPRVTRVGRFLRRTSLDELPQLLNVVIGQMSLVGPRPLPLRDVRLLEDTDKLRHVVLPGMTGLWQVSGRSNISADDMLRLDREYVESWSISLDVSILFRTVAVVFTGKGAC